MSHQSQKSIGDEIEMLAKLTGAPPEFVEQVRALFLNKAISLDEDATPYSAALEEAFVRAEKRGVLIHGGAAIKEIAGDKHVERVILASERGDVPLDVEAVFIFREVPTGPMFAKAGLAMDHKQCLAVDRFQRTNLEGVFAAGDLTCGGLQVVSAAGEGCVAALQALVFLRKTE